MKKKDSVGVLIFDVNNRGRESGTYHMESKELQDEIQKFIENLKKTQNKTISVVYCVTEKVTEENKPKNFLTNEEYLNFKGEELPYCMFEARLFSHYNEKIVSSEADKRTSYLKKESESSGHEKGEYFPEKFIEEAISTDSVYGAVNYLNNQGVKKVYLTGIQKNVQKITEQWGLSYMFAKNMEPVLVKSLIDMNVSEYSFPYRAFPKSKDYLIDMLCEERFVGHNGDTKYCRAEDSEFSVRHAELWAFQGKEKAEVDFQKYELENPGSLMKKGVILKYLKIGSPGFVRKISYKQEHGFISSIAQYFDYTPGGFVVIESSEAGARVLKAGQEPSDEFQTLIELEPGEYINRLEIVSRLCEEKQYVTGIRILTTKGTVKESLSENTIDDSEWSSVYDASEPSGQTEAICFLDQIVISSAEESGTSGRIPIIGYKTGRFNQFQVKTEGGDTSLVNRLEFVYLYKIRDRGEREEYLEFEFTYYDGKFYLYDKEHRFLRKSAFLVMTGKQEDEKYCLTPELLRDSLEGRRELPYLYTKEEAGTFFLINNEKTDSQAIPQLLEDCTVDNDDLVKKNNLAEIKVVLPQSNIESVSARLSETYHMALLFSDGKASASGSLELFAMDMEGYYLLNSQSDIEKLADLVNGGVRMEDQSLYAEKRYRLTDNLVWDNDWTVIGSEKFPFCGIFDGNGHWIRNISAKDSGNEKQGVIGVLDENGRVENLAVLNGKIQGRDYVGGIVGENRGKVTNCFFEGEIEACGKYAGGIAGICKGVVSKCIVSGKIKGIQYVGGLCGAMAQNKSGAGCEVSYSYSLCLAEAQQNSDYLCGWAEGNCIIRNCTAMAYRIDIKEGICNAFWREVMGEIEELDFETYTVPVIRKLSGSIQIEGLKKNACFMK